MNGIDILVFTGGIGENDPYIRQEILKHLTYLGVDINYELNAQVRGKEVELSTPQSKVRVCVIPTDEELMIASDTMELI
jgi:acetate kinase